jgi:sorbitol/mannitol transport system permease protein
MAADATHSTLRTRVTQVQLSESWRRRLPLLPALLFVVVLTQVPFVLSIWYSLTDWTVVPPGPRQWVGLDNYSNLFSDSFFGQAAWVSVKLTVVPVLGSLVLGSAFALLIDRKFFGQGVVRTLLITPFLLMPVVVGLIWKNQMFSSLYGVINWVIDKLGATPVEFVDRYPTWAIALTLIWQWTPFMMLIVLAGLQSQPEDVPRGGQGRRGDALRHLPATHAQPPAALHGAGHPARHDLPPPGLRPGRGDDRRRARIHQHPLLRLPAIDRRRLGVRPGVVLQHRRRHRLDHHRHERVAGPVRSAQGRGGGMSDAKPPRGVGERWWVNTGFGLLAWVVGLIFFFPVFWMVLNSFKSEQDANASPKFFFHPTLDRYRDVTKSTTGLLSFGEAFSNSAVVVIVSTLIVLALAIPAAYALAIRPVLKWRDVLFFFISTKFLPIVASILPIWILAKNLNLLNTRLALIILYIAINLPLAVWMLRSFFREVSRELIEAAEIDGAGLRGQMTSIILPLAAPGIAATALLCLIFAWNEYFYAVQLNPVHGSTVPIWVTTEISTRGQFLAKLSAASVLACIPVVLAGWIAQKRMIRGLAMGAIK